MWLKLAKIDQFSNSFGYFHIYQVVDHIRDSFRTICKKWKISKKSKNSIFGQFLPIFEQKLVEQAPGPQWYIMMQVEFEIALSVERRETQQK
jgi:hypothetical protein